MKHPTLLLLSLLACSQTLGVTAEHSIGAHEHKIHARDGGCHAGHAGRKRDLAGRWLPDSQVKPVVSVHSHVARQMSNPWTDKTLSPSPRWAEKLETVYRAFKHRGDRRNAAKVRVLQRTGNFVWVSSVGNLSEIDLAINAARVSQRETNTTQIVGLVLYNIPGRDWDGKMSSGEFPPTNLGLETYKSKFVRPFADKLKDAQDLTFAIIVEPDAIGNLVTNKDEAFRKRVARFYEQGIAHAIKSLQSPNIHVYVDVANGGWLGWDDTLQPTVDALGKVLRMAKQQSGNSTTIRGFSTNVSNFNLFSSGTREAFTKGSRSWDESHYILALAPLLQRAGLPQRFIVDQSRVSLPGARKKWTQWANVAPAAFGAVPGSAVGNIYVDSIVWVKPAGESDGPDGFPGAPAAGVWFPQYAQMMIKNTKI